MVDDRECGLATLSLMSRSQQIHFDAPAGASYFRFAREFDASIARVFAARIEPELVARWMYPAGAEMAIERYDCQTGGSYRYRHLQAAITECFGRLDALLSE